MSLLRNASVKTAGQSRCLSPVHKLLIIDSEYLILAEFDLHIDYIGRRCCFVYKFKWEYP